MASSVNQTVRLPRWRRAASYCRQFVTRCRCFGMWWRRSAVALNGKNGILECSGRQDLLMWDRTAEPSPADTARRRNPGPQILRSHPLGRGTVFFVIEPKDPGRSMQQDRLDSTFIRSRDDRERHLEVRVGNIETETGGCQVFGAVT